MKLTLKKRLNNDYITIPTGVLQVVKDKSIDQMQAGMALYNYFNDMIDGELTTHDKSWLTMIVNWSAPNVGMSMMDIAKWLDLAKRIDEVDDDVDEVEFTLLPKEAEIIFEKLKNEEFKIVKVTSSLMYFLNDLQEATKMTLLPESEEK